MAKVIKFPKSRDKVVDLLAEGARKHIIYIQFDADIDELRHKQVALKSRGNPLSLTPILVHCYAQSIEQHR
jgi:hypothetical protein